MREIPVSMVTETVRRLCTQASTALPEDTVDLLNKALEAEESEPGKANLRVALENNRIAGQTHMPVCQDTGMVAVFLEVGQDVHFTGGLLEEAVNEGVREAYVPFRKSVLTPLSRRNTGDNTPCVLHTSLCAGENVRILVAPKGFGSENMSRLKMLKPSEGIDGVRAFVTETVSLAGANPCPPVVVGVGIGGTIEKAALMAKHSLAAAVPANDPDAAALEAELLERINRLGIGPQGQGGRITALKVFVELYPTHIAGLPVAVNIQCHCARHGEAVL